MRLINGDGCGLALIVTLYHTTGSAMAKRPLQEDTGSAMAKRPLQEDIMKKAIAVLVIIGVSFICGGMAFSQEAKEFELKLGTRKEAVGRKYGEPIMKEKIKSR
ncbi:MAG: hypothetical protein JW800_03480, partial [Candidatus Omnitrophica bacterium]|nr:hypothetical protein [Candidatus Omnitrophota bacterium]